MAGDGRVHVLFQPHLFSRTREFAAEFADLGVPVIVCGVDDPVEPLLDVVGGVNINNHLRSLAAPVDVLVIGAGQAGVPLARALAAAGRDVLLIERDALGGSCVNFGCTPSKAVIASARLSLEAAAEAAGVPAVILSDAIEGEARDVGRVHAAIAREIALRDRPFARPVVLLSGGETTVTLRGDPGRGGQLVPAAEYLSGDVRAKLETARAAAIEQAQRVFDGLKDAANQTREGISGVRSTQSTMPVAMAARGMPACSASSGSWATVRPPRSLMRLIKPRTTVKDTSASSSARRISRAVALMSASVSLPLPRRPARADCRRSDSESNTTDALP